MQSNSASRLERLRASITGRQLASPCDHFPNTVVFIQELSISTETKPKFTYNVPIPGGQIQAAVWENEQTKGDESFTSLSITLARRYYDDTEQKWKTAKSFRASDLLAIAFASQELFRQLTSEKQKS